MTSMSIDIIEKITQMISMQMYIGQETTLKSKSLEAAYVKNNVSLLPTTNSIQNNTLSFGSYCDLLSSSDCKNKILTQKVDTTKFYNFN